MSITSITIAKDDVRSKILGESYSVFLDKSEASAYISLVKKTWPSLKIEKKH